MPEQTLKELFVEQIRDIYDAEKQLVKALPKMAKAAESEELSEAITNHLEETKQQVSRLEEIFALLEMPARGKSCKGMKGLIEEGEEAVGENAGEMRDLAIIAGAQRVEHYEISAYGTARTIAEQLGMSQAAQLLRETEDEEANADSGLTQIAIGIYESIDASEDEGDEAMAESQTRGSASRGVAKKARAGGR